MTTTMTETVTLIVGGMAMTGIGAAVFFVAGLLLVEAGRAKAERGFHQAEMRSLLDGRRAVTWCLVAQIMGASLVSFGFGVLSLAVM